jgi:pimeloyl-ACP methyl ester carboxylesterase
MTKIQNFKKVCFLLLIVSTSLSSTVFAQQTDSLSKVIGYAPVNGLKIYYEIHGTGNPLILLHGSYHNIDMSWGAIIPELSKARKVIAIEMQGHGRTADIKRDFDFNSLADDVNDLMTYLKIDSADVMGYSLGGSVAYKFAINHPTKLKKLIILSATYKSTGWQKEARDILRMMKPEFLTNTPLKTQYDLHAPDKANWPNFLSKLIKFNSTEFNFGDDAIKSIKSSVFIIAVDNDGLDKTELANNYKLIGGCTFGDINGLPKSQLLVLPATTHNSIVMQGIKFIPSINDFLK